MSGYSLVQRTAQKQITLPKLKNSHSFGIRFFPIWIILFGASWGASYGWQQYMQDCCSSSVGKNSYTFIAWVISFCIFLWTLISIYSKLSRVRALNSIVNYYTRIADEILLYSANAITAQSSVLKFFWKNNQTEYILEHYKALAELLLALTSSLMLFIYESTSSNKLQGDEAMIIVNHITLSQTLDVYMLRDMFSDEIAKPTIAAGDTSFSILMLTLVTDRIQGMAGSSMFTDINILLSQIAHLKDEIEMYNENPLDFANEDWIMWPIMFIGFVFPFLIPPIFYSTMSSDILYIGPVIFFFIGSPIIINLVLGDPVRWPSNLHMQKVYDKIYLFSFKVKSKYYDKFTPLIKHLKYQLSQLSLQYTQLQQQSQQTAQVVENYNSLYTIQTKFNADIENSDYLRTAVAVFMPINNLVAFNKVE